MIFLLLGGNKTDWHFFKGGGEPKTDVTNFFWGGGGPKTDWGILGAKTAWNFFLGGGGGGKPKTDGEYVWEGGGTKTDWGFFFGGGDARFGGWGESQKQMGIFFMGGGGGKQKQIGNFWGGGGGGAIVSEMLPSLQLGDLCCHSYTAH